MNYLKSHLFENGIPFNIRFFVLKMDCTIQFNDEAGLMTIEINDKTGDYLLSPKMDILQPVFSQPLPKQSLRPRHASAERFRFQIFRFMDSLAGADIPWHVYPPDRQ
jgi:hypothetical protein